MSKTPSNHNVICSSGGETLRSSNPHSKEPLLKLDSQNHHATEREYCKLLVAEMTCALLAAVGFACAAIAYDLEYSSSTMHEKEATLAVIIATGNFTTVLLILGIAWRLGRELRWQQAQCIYALQDTFYSAGKLKELVIEVGLNVLHPIWWIRGEKFDSYIEVLDSTVQYTYNSMLAVCTIVRLYHLIRLVCSLTKFRSGRAQRVCRMNGCVAGKWFAAKCLMEDSPAYMLVCLFFGSILLGAWLIRIFERPAFPLTGMDFSSYNNALWQVLVTMTTVGYGDFYPVTHPGRIVTILVCGWGVMLMSLVVLVLLALLELAGAEAASRTLMVRLQFKSEMREVAAKLIGCAVKCRQHIKKGQISDSPSDFPSSPLSAPTVSIYTEMGKLRQSINCFQSMQIQKRSLYEKDSFEEKFDSDLRALEELTEKSIAQVAEIKGIAMEAESLL